MSNKWSKSIHKWKQDQNISTENIKVCADVTAEVCAWDSPAQQRVERNTAKSTIKYKLSQSLISKNHSFPAAQPASPSCLINTTRPADNLHNTPAAAQTSAQQETFIQWLIHSNS